MKNAIILVAAASLLLMSVAACSRVLPSAEKGGSPGQGKNPPLAMENGKQVITILARGGYSPPETTAKAGVPSTLRIVTQKTYDCSRSLILPSLRVQEILPATGTIDFSIPAQNQGTRFYGICGMGMYRFVVAFK